MDKNVCPKCGAANNYDATVLETWVCGSINGFQSRSARCYEKEIAQLKARVEKLEAVVKAVKLINCHRQYSTDKAWGILSESLKDLEPPDA